MYCLELPKAITTTVSNKKSCCQNFQPIAKSECLPSEKSKLFNSGPVEKQKPALSSPPYNFQDLPCFIKTRKDEPLKKNLLAEPNHLCNQARPQ